MSTMTPARPPVAADPYEVLTAAAQSVAALRPLFRSLGVPLTGVALTHLDDGGVIVLRTTPDAAVQIADTLGLDDRVQVRTSNCWVRGYEGPVALSAEHRMRVVAVADGPSDGCRPLKLAERGRIEALFAAVAL